MLAAIDGFNIMFAASIREGFFSKNLVTSGNKIISRLKTISPSRLFTILLETVCVGRSDS